MQHRARAIEAKQALAEWRARSIAPLIAFVVFCFGGMKAIEAGELPMIPADEPAREPNPPPPPLPGQATGLERDESNLSALKRLCHRAIEQEKSLSNYVCRIRRREQVNGKDQPEETIMLKYCRAPLSIHCKWLGDEAKGREIIYVQGQRDNRVNILTGKGDIVGSGKRMTFPLESPVVRSKSRHPLTEAGMGAPVVRFAALINAIDHGQASAGSVRYLGLQSRSEFPKPVEAVEQTLPANFDPFLPRGGSRYFFFDEATGLPTLIVTFDDAKRQVEYYHFDRLQSPANLDEFDFDPDFLWRK